MPRPKDTPTTGLAKFAEQPAWLQTGGVVLAALVLWKLVTGGVDTFFSLPDEIERVEGLVAKVAARVEKLEEMATGFRVDITRLGDASARLEQDRLQRETREADATRRAADKATEDKQRFWDQQRSQDRENLREMFRKERDDAGPPTGRRKEE